jgi:hypothetical protein
VGNQRIVAVEPPGRDLELFNNADPHCELCGGLGRVPRRIGTRDLRTKACECTKGRR